MAIDVSRDIIEAAPEAVGLSAGRLGASDALVRRYVEGGRWAGAISMVARHGRVAHFETFGQRDAEAGLPMTPDTIFRMASMTKPIASVALMTLFEEAHFLIDTPIAEFIPAFRRPSVFAGGTPERYHVRPAVREITVRDLLTHTSGLTGAGENTTMGQIYQRADLFGHADRTLDEVIPALAALPLCCDPGAEFNYGASTDVVGYLCELISGKPLDAFLQERIFEPLGMVDTAFHVPASKRDRFAALYVQGGANGALRTRNDGPRPNAMYEEGARYLAGAGGLTSTASDYMRFAKMLASGGTLDGERVIGARTLGFMTANHLRDGLDLGAMAVNPLATWMTHGTGFGLGFAVLMDPVRSGVLGTPGEYYWNGAYSTSFFVSPAEDLIAILLTQLGGSDYQIRREWRSTIYQALL